MKYIIKNKKGFVYNSWLKPGKYPEWDHLEDFDKGTKDKYFTLQKARYMLKEIHNCLCNNELDLPTLKIEIYDKE